MSIFHLPTRLIYAPGSLRSFDLTEMHCRSIGIFCSKSVLDRCVPVAEWLDTVKQVIPNCFVEALPSGEPCLQTVEFVRELIESHSADLAVAIGGGSVIDAVKAAVAVAFSDASVEQCFYGKRPLSHRSCRFIAVPSTAGSGAELTPNAVLSDPKNRTKKSLRGLTLFPDIAIVDPELLQSLSDGVAAASGADALVQAIESYTSRFATPLTSAISLDAVFRLERSLERFVRSRDEISCQEMSIASSMTAIAFTQSGLGAVHGVVHTIGLISHTPHGVCCAAFLPSVIEMNYKDCKARYDYLAEMWGAPPADHIRQLFSRISLPPDLKHLNIPQSEFDFIIDSSLDTNSMKSNPRKLGRDELLELLITVL